LTAVDAICDDEPVDVDVANRSATLVGCGSGAIGVAALLAPKRINKLLGISSDPAMRAIGVADLVLVPGLIGGRQRWRWIAARAALNLAIVGVFLRSRSGASTPSRPLAAAVGLAIVTVGDLRVGRALYAARR
jgi:hypothetical protein